jgi:hypothetical protein
MLYENNLKYNIKMTFIKFLLQSLKETENHKELQKICNIGAASIRLIISAKT